MPRIAVLESKMARATIGRAKQHVGETKCVTGKVLNVKVGAKGVHFVEFCEEQAA